MHQFSAPVCDVIPEVRCCQLTPRGFARGDAADTFVSSVSNPRHCYTDADYVSDHQQPEDTAKTVELRAPPVGDVLHYDSMIHRVANECDARFKYLVLG